MEKKRLEVKVGLFVFIGLVLLAVLLLQFSKGMSVFRGTYELRLHAKNVGGLKTRSMVLMSGVQVGYVSGINLAPDGKSVTIFLKIYEGYRIYSDAKFRIEQSGFLGDQYVAIVPTENAGRELKPGNDVDCEEPFNLQEVARAAGGFVKRIDETAKKLNEAVVNVRELLLNEQTLTNLAATVTTMRSASERALATMVELNVLFATNAPVISYSVSNLGSSSDDIKRFAGGLDVLLETNGPAISAAVKNLETSTATLKQILNDVQAGKGVAGELLHNEAMAGNVANILDNLSVTTSNLNRLGLWGIMWSKKPKTAPAATQRVESPKETAP